MIRIIKMYLRTLGVSGLLSGIKAKFSSTPVLYKVQIPGYAHPFDLRMLSSDVPTYRQVFVDNEYDFNVERSPEVIVDAGANIGLAAIYFANRYPDARIIAIEPELSNFEILEKNTADYPNITALQAALWHKNEEINLVDPGLGKWGFMTEVKDPTEDHVGKPCHVVDAFTVDRLIDDYDLGHIDILKIDIEGAEREVFSDTDAWIDRVDSLIVELHERMKPGCNRSFYNGSNGFDIEWKQGENVYLSRGNTLIRHMT